MTAAYQPLYSATAINNKAAIITDGVDDALYVQEWGVISHPFTRAFVFNPVTMVSGKHYINNQNPQPGGEFNVADNTTTSTIGYSLDGSGPVLNACNARFGEVLVIPGVLSTDSRQKLEGYLAWKWALESSLPSGHPYKNMAPTQ
ncbi:MAG: hypothetical protein EBW87_02680 [Burkholderiaceae bacterium]|nr:hypothetical protein [Burkholderiaceae bacterium]